MTTPVALAPTTFVAGKTNQSQVLDVYEGTVETTQAENQISSILGNFGNNLLNDAKKGVLKVFDNKDLTKDLRNLTKGLIKGDMNSSDVKNLLKGYKEGALTTILNETGLKDFEKMGKNVIENVTKDVKSLAFNPIKGFVDQLVPGLLDEAGIKTFDDAERLYKNIDKIFDSSDNFTEFLIGNEKGFSELSSFVFDKSIDTLNSILPQAIPIAKSKNVDLDTAIAAAVALPLIQDDCDAIVDWLFDSMADDEQKSKFVAATASEAMKEGSINFILAAERNTSASFIRDVTKDVLPSDFLGNVKVSVPDTKAAIDIEADKLRRATEILTGKTGNDIPADIFKKVEPGTPQYQIIVQDAGMTELLGVSQVAKLLPETNWMGSQFGYGQLF